MNIYQGGTMNRTRTTLATAATALLLTTPLAASAAPGNSAAENSGTNDAAGFHEQVTDYAQAHPGDYEGLSELAEQLGGEISVSTNITGPTTPERAAQLQSSVEAPPSGGGISIAAIPDDGFVVSISTARHPSSTVASVSGTWNWRDDFIGQGAPVDIAALRFSDGCVLYGATGASTYRYDNVSTDRASLRSAGVGTGGPIWNISDAVSNFMNYTDHGTVTQSVDLAGCTGPVQAAFDYEANVDGSVLSASIGWGGLSVSYGNPSSVLKKSSAATTL